MREDELGSIIGNLIENSFDEVKTDGSGTVHFKIFELDESFKNSNKGQWTRYC